MLSGWRLPLCAACHQISTHSISRGFSVTAASSSGSNKWAKVKHKKGAKDAAKSNMYSALSREIIASVRNHPTHSTSVEHNPRLGMILKKAKEMDVPKERIELTLKKAANASSGGSTISYEILGPPTRDNVPVAMIVECQTDSPTRSMAKVKEAVNKNNARLSSTAHLFERTGVVRFNIKNGDTFDDVWEMAVENGAQDVRPLESDDEGTSLGLEVICDPSDLHRLTSLFSSPPLSHEIIESETKMVASGPLLQIRDSEEDGAAQEEETSLASTTSWLDEDDMQRLDTLVAALEEGAECHRVWSNVAGWPA